MIHFTCTKPWSNYTEYSPTCSDTDCQNCQWGVQVEHDSVDIKPYQDEWAANEWAAEQLKKIQNNIRTRESWVVVKESRPREVRTPVLRSINKGNRHFFHKE